VFCSRFTSVAAMAAVAIVVSATPAASEAVGRDGAPAVRSVAAHDGAGDFRIARDVSFPQCGGPLPKATSGSLGVLGTNNGAAFTTNPCLVTELAWAKRLPSPPAFYANTGNPGPARSKHWPIGQTSPKVCAASNPNSIGCSFDYGWNAGQQSFRAATDAAQRLHRVSRDDARHRAANVQWWLDVETMNSWLTVDGSPTRAAAQRDTAALVGQVDALLFAGVTQVGIYSTPYQWDLITGGSSVTNGQFGPLGQWLAGYESKAEAAAGCGHKGFMAGPVRMTQYLAADGFDANVICVDPSGD
jgi:hypothetical protein